MKSNRIDETDEKRNGIESIYSQFNNNYIVNLSNNLYNVIQNKNIIQITIIIFINRLKSIIGLVGKYFFFVERIVVNKYIYYIFIFYIYIFIFKGCVMQFFSL